MFRKPQGSSSGGPNRSKYQDRGKGPKPFRGGRPGAGGEQGGQRFFRKKINRFYTVFSERAQVVDYKDTERLGRFLTERGKIMPRRITGLTAKQQRLVACAIKLARHAGLLPFQAE